MVLLWVVVWCAYTSGNTRTEIKELLGRCLLRICMGSTPLDSTRLIRSALEILVGSIKHRLGIWSVAYAWVYRRRMSAYLQRDFYCFNGVFF
jgi:hypothetical protein